MRRVVAFPLTRLLLIVAVFAVAVVALALLHPPKGVRVAIAVNWALAAILAAAAILVERFAVRKAPAAIGLDPRDAPRELTLGALLGAALFSTVVLELALGGFYRIASVHVTADLALAALLLLPGAAIEELLFRGVLFRLVEEWLGTWIALAISAALFGGAHFANPGATASSSIAIALEAGILLGAAYVVTRNLWFPIGLHFAWNFFEGPVFGTQVSGRSFLTDAVVSHVTGPRLLTGGSFGPEAGLFAIVTCLIAAVALLAVAARRGRFVAPFWRRA
jgi:hypothetical protein